MYQHSDYEHHLRYNHATVTGLPAGVTGNWSANVVTITGTPSVAGTFTYTVTMTGGCTGGTNTITGTITVLPNNTIALSSGAGTNNQVHEHRNDPHHFWDNNRNGRNGGWSSGGGNKQLEWQCGYD
ncbi:MAG: hypothetical protein EBR22_05605 [Cytophagia bacterium]|nr:hypothetical protein [Cytophagia bacterium]